MAVPELFVITEFHCSIQFPQFILHLCGVHLDQVYQTQTSVRAAHLVLNREKS
jgi:hypothetical protein